MPAAQWWQAIAFCLLMSLYGLQFLPILLVIALWLIKMWKQNRYFFLVEVMILVGHFGLANFNLLPIRISDMGMAIGVIMLIIYRKSPKVRLITIAMLGYFALMIFFATKSLESMSIQFLNMRNYMTIIGFFIPLLTFANKEFEWSKFLEALTAHALVICGFYVVDAYIIGGFMLLPATNANGIVVTYYDPYYSNYTARHYPPGLYLLLPLVPAITFNKIKLSIDHYILIALSLLASRTNTMLFALLICWAFFRPQIKQIIKYILALVIVVIALYHIDVQTGGYMRVAENIDQFSILELAEDDEDLAKFGTGRMAQILPKWELLERMDRVNIGFGFLHRDKTTNPHYIIKNPFYTDVTQSEEVATGVEVTQVQTILDIGLYGLIAQTLFYIGIYFIIRKYEQSKYYLSTLVGISVLGIGGFAGLNSVHGLVLLSFVLGAILCANKERQPSPSISHSTPRLLTE